MIEWLGILIKPVLGWLYDFGRSYKAKQSPEYILRQREKWKGHFSNKLSEPNCSDVYLINIKDSSQYIRCGLLQTYEDGITLGYGWCDLEQIAAHKWIERVADNSICLIKCFYIPYHWIEYVDWEGSDELEYLPQIYIRFIGKRKQRYCDKIAYCDKNKLGGSKNFYYHIIVDGSEVQQ